MDREVKFTSIPLSKNKIELKSLILAQIERWRHALPRKSNGRGATVLTSGERVSNTSERAQSWG